MLFFSVRESGEPGIERGDKVSRDGRQAIDRTSEKVRRDQPERTSKQPGRPEDYGGVHQAGGRGLDLDPRN